MYFTLNMQVDNKKQLSLSAVLMFCYIDLMFSYIEQNYLINKI